MNPRRLIPLLLPVVYLAAAGCGTAPVYPPATPVAVFKTNVLSAPMPPMPPPMIRNSSVPPQTTTNIVGTNIIICGENPLTLLPWCVTNPPPPPVPFSNIVYLSATFANRLEIFSNATIFFDVKTNFTSSWTRLVTMPYPQSGGEINAAWSNGPPVFFRAGYAIQ